MTDRPPQRLSPLTPIVRGFIVQVAAAWTILRDVTRGEIGPTATLFVLLLVAGGIYGGAAWLRTKFWIEADELRVDTGVISRQSRRIRIDRLQGVDIVQPFVARMFGLAELRVDVAGGNAREGSLAYLSLSEARRLKDLLLDRRDELGALKQGPTSVDGPAVSNAPADVAASNGQAVAEPGPHDGVAATAQSPASGRGYERRIARVDFSRLVLSILLSGETITLVLVTLSLLVAFTASGQWIGFSAMLPVILGFGIALFRRFSANYGFTVAETPAGLQVRRGLFDVNAQTIALTRVQGIVITEPWLWRKLGWAKIDVSIAGYGAGADSDGPAPSTILPVGDLDLVQDLARHVLQGLDPEAVRLRPVPRRARWLEPIGYRYIGVGTDENLIVSREGRFGRRTNAAPQVRVQSLRITQGPLQRRLGLADVHADSPPGATNVTARHRDAAEARRLFDVEVAMTAWARRQRS